MAPPDPDLRTLERAARARQKAEDQLRAARESVRDEIIAAHAAGASLSAIGRVIGVSRQRVAAIVEEG
jgi:hypothetical protein